MLYFVLETYLHPIALPTTFRQCAKVITKGTCHKQSLLCLKNFLRLALCLSSESSVLYFVLYIVNLYPITLPLGNLTSSHFPYFVWNPILSTLLCSISLTCVSSNEIGSFEFRQQSKLYLPALKDCCNCNFLEFLSLHSFGSREVKCILHPRMDELCNVHAYKSKWKKIKSVM